jgi:YD repeat-containing protein
MNILSRLFIPAGFLLFASACQKQNTISPTPTPIIQNPDTTKTDSVKFHLAAFDERSDDSSFINYTGFEYDASGRIIRGFSYNLATIFTVTYNGNEALMLLNIPDIGIPGLYNTDTIRFTLDADNNALKRVHYHYLHDDGSSGSQPLTEYVYDTTDYEYDAAGLLKRETVRSRDSSIRNISGSISISNSYVDRVADFTVTDGNVTEIKSVWSQNNQTVEKTTTFEYSNAYPNHARLTNPAILMELHMFYDWPMNDKYKNIPENVVNKTVYTDAGGTVLNTIETSNPMSLLYGTDGYLTTLIDPAFPSNIKFYFRYSK